MHEKPSEEYTMGITLNYENVACWLKEQKIRDLAEFHGSQVWAKSCFSTFSNTGHLLTVWGQTASFMGTKPVVPTRLWNVKDGVPTKWLVDDLPWSARCLPSKASTKIDLPCVCMSGLRRRRQEAEEAREEQSCGPEKSKETNTESWPTAWGVFVHVCMCVNLSMLLHFHQLLTLVRTFLPFLTAWNDCLRAETWL